MLWGVLGWQGRLQVCRGAIGTRCWGTGGGVCAVVVLECSKKPMGGIGELWGRLGF